MENLKKKVNDFHSKQILLLLSLLSGSGEPIAASAKTSSLFCSRGFRPRTRNRVPPLHPAGGPGGSQTPQLVGASGPQCRLLFLILLLLEILTTLRKLFFFFQVTIYNEVSVIKVFLFYSVHVNFLLFCLKIM